MKMSRALIWQARTGNECLGQRAAANAPAEPCDIHEAGMRGGTDVNSVNAARRGNDWCRDGPEATGLAPQVHRCATDPVLPDA